MPRANYCLTNNFFPKLKKGRFHLHKQYSGYIAKACKTKDSLGTICEKLTINVLSK